MALAEALAPLLPDRAALTLKWPNDVLLDQRKLAGILLDSAATPAGGLDWLVIGIGMNLAAAPALPDRAAACLAEMRGPAGAGGFWPVGAGPPRGVAGFLADRLRPGSCSMARLRPADRERDAIQAGRALDQGTFDGLADDGSLLLQTGDQVHAFATGEVLLPGTDN